MLIPILLVLGVIFSPTEARAQITAELHYGLDRNVQTTESERDGWLSATVEWTLAPGFGLGIGTDLQFERAPARLSDHQGGAVYLSVSRELRFGAVAPFVRGGLGLGRAPCEGDTCGDGLHLRGSTGLRAWLTDRFGLSGEIGLSRVSRPFGGAGLSVRF